MFDKNKENVAKRTPNTEFSQNVTTTKSSSSQVDSTIKMTCNGDLHNEL
jgi:hypothetical protein